MRRSTSDPAELNESGGSSQRSDSQKSLVALSDSPWRPLLRGSSKLLQLSIKTEKTFWGSHRARRTSLGPSPYAPHNTLRHQVCLSLDLLARIIDLTDHSSARLAAFIRLPCRGRSRVHGLDVQGSLALSRSLSLRCMALVNTLNSSCSEDPGIH